jgi:hypothetical protein
LFLFASGQFQRAGFQRALALGHGCDLRQGGGQFLLRLVLLFDELPGQGVDPLLKLSLQRAEALLLAVEELAGPLALRIDGARQTFPPGIDRRLTKCFFHGTYQRRGQSGPRMRATNALGRTPSML